MKKIITLLGLILIAYTGAFLYGKAGIPSFTLENTNALPLEAEKSLPFYELMSPLPTGADLLYLPKLEYKKGPPDRYIESITLFFFNDPSANKERITYFGRKSIDNTFPAWLTGEQGINIFWKAALHYAASGEVPEYWKGSALLLPLTKIAFLLEARELLTGVSKVITMDQAGSPSFLFHYEGGKKAKILFARRNSLYEIQLSTDKQFHFLDPEKFFAKCFLVEKRADAMGFIVRQLTQVQFGARKIKNISLRDAAWPMALLSANLSVDPSSIDAYFHFAGLNALLYKSSSTDSLDIESTDTLRNNVIAADLYGKDIAPTNPKSGEMGQLSRTLTSKFSQ